MNISDLFAFSSNPDLVFVTYGIGILAATGLAVAIRNRIATPITVSTIVKDLQDTVTNLELHAQDKIAAVKQYEAQIAAHLEAKVEAEIEHAKAISIASNIGQLIGAHA